jgi:hypothetical protein
MATVSAPLYRGNRNHSIPSHFQVVYMEATQRDARRAGTEKSIDHYCTAVEGRKVRGTGFCPSVGKSIFQR